MATPIKLANGNYSYTDSQGITTTGTQEAVNTAAAQPTTLSAVTQPPVSTVPPVAQPTVTPPPPTTTQPVSSVASAQTVKPTAVMPANGSVVDLLNQTGQSSAFADRAALAQQFGIQGYTGSATQNTDLAKKYLDFYNSKQGTVAPNSNPRQEIQDSVGTNTAQQPDPQAQFVDTYASMNPIVKSIYDTIQQTFSTQATRQSLVDTVKSMPEFQQEQGLKADLLNVQNVMNGTEDDVRNEITAAGGSGTESQVLAITAARNKTLQKQANSLVDQIQQKDDYINQIVQLTQADRAQVDQDLETKLGLTQKVLDLQTNMDNAAKENYNNIVDKVGYAGLAASLKDNPQQQTQVEQLLGIPKGALSDPAFLGQQDAGKVLGSAATGYFTYNPYTGETTPLATGSSGGNSNVIPTGSPTSAPSGTIPTLNGKPLTDAQSTTLGYVQRLNDSDKIINQVGGQFTGFLSNFGGYLPNALKSSDRQQYEQAQRNFINAVLRRESGAAISPSEFDSAAQQYFPQPGDSAAVVAQKSANRARVINSLSQSANVPESYIKGEDSSSSSSYDDYLKAIGQ